MPASSTVNRQIEEMQAKLPPDTSRKLDQTNTNLALTNDKFDETNDRFVALDRVFQRLPLSEEVSGSTDLVCINIKRNISRISSPGTSLHLI